MYIPVIIGRCPKPKVPSVSPPFLMNKGSTSTPSMSASTSLPLSPSESLNPLAKSWIPEAETTPFDSQNFLDAKKSAIMYPHEFFSTTSTSPCPPAVTLWPASAINQPFEQLHLLSQPISTTPYVFHNPSVHYYEVSYWCNSQGCLQPQPYQHAVLSLFGPTVPLISWSSTNDLKKGMGGNDSEKKTDSRICGGEKDWKTKRRLVPPRFERSQNMAYQVSKKTLRQEWKAKKANSDNGVVSAGAALVPSSTPPTQSPIGDFQHCKKTTVMIRNIPNQYRRNSLMQFLDLCCKSHNLEYDFFYLPMDFRRNDNLGYAFVNFTTPEAAMKIMDLLEGFEWYGNRISGETIRSKKICEMSWADIQGKNALVKHFENSHFVCDQFEYLPVILSPPRNGSETRNRPITVGKLRGLNKFPRLMRKKPSVASSQPTTSNEV